MAAKGEAIRPNDMGRVAAARQAFDGMVSRLAGAGRAAFVGHFEPWMKAIEPAAQSRPGRAL